MVFHAWRFRGEGSRPGRGRIWVNVTIAIYPGSLPGAIVDDDGVRSPAKADATPSPRQERSNENTRTEADSAPDEEPGPRPEEDNIRVIVRNVNNGRVHRNNLDVARTRSNHFVLRVSAQV